MTKDDTASDPNPLKPPGGRGRACGGARDAGAGPRRRAGTEAGGPAMMIRRVAPLLILLLAGSAAFGALAWHPAIAPEQPPTPEPALVARGATLAALGDCAACHTAPGGRAYAGGVRLQTPFGAVYGANLTPDPRTGIGRWSLAAFTRAMRRGVGRDGRNLYPALPYDHFTELDDADLAALYAFLQAGEPVRATPPRNELVFPLGWRPLLAGWKLLFLRGHRFRPDPAHDAAWNRGAYLVEGLGHCGACHTPRNALGAEERGRFLTGGVAEGWRAWPLAGAPWGEEELFRYLRTGLAARHGAAAGPMAPVTWNLARVPESDVRAMAVYLASLATPEREPPPADPRAGVGAAGAVLFAGACGACHGAAGPMHAAGVPYLNASTAVRAADPGNVLRVILGGIHPPPGTAGPSAAQTPAAWMPAYAAILDDAQVAAVAALVRARYAPGQPAWTDLAARAARIRGEGGAS